MSLSDFRVTAIVPVSNIARARTFYEQVLGCRPVSVRDGEVVYEGAEGSRLQIYVPGDLLAVGSGATEVTWEVDDIEDEVTWFEEAGVEFMSLNVDGDVIFTDGDGTKMAWFQDPDDNWLCLHQVA